MLRPSISRHPHHSPFYFSPDHPPLPLASLFSAAPLRSQQPNAITIAITFLPPHRPHPRPSPLPFLLISNYRPLMPVACPACPPLSSRVALSSSRSCVLSACPLQLASLCLLSGLTGPAFSCCFPFSRVGEFVVRCAQHPVACVRRPSSLPLLPRNHAFISLAGCYPNLSSRLLPSPLPCTPVSDSAPSARSRARRRLLSSPISASSPPSPRVCFCCEPELRFALSLHRCRFFASGRYPIAARLRVLLFSAVLMRCGLRCLLKQPSVTVRNLVIHTAAQILNARMP